MFNPIFNPQVTLKHEHALHVLIECILAAVVPNEINIYAYRIGTGCFHIMKLDNQLEITITDGHVDIPDKENCLDSLRVGHIQIGVLDCMDVTYTIAHIIEKIKVKNNSLTYSYQTQFIAPKKYEYTEQEINTLSSLTKAASATELSRETQTQDWEKWMRDDDHSPKFELNYNGSPIFVDMLTLLQCLKIAEHTHHLPTIDSKWWLQIIKQYPVEINLDGRIRAQN